MTFMTQLAFGGNFFAGRKSAELNPFSTVSQVIRYHGLSLKIAKI
jgi:hypothetical protein